MNNNTGAPRVPELGVLSDRKLVFSAMAWMKLQYFLHAGPTEVGGFGITKPEDPLYVTKFAVVDQEADGAFVRFTDDGVANLIEDYAFDPDPAKRLKPENVSRIWIHTHPGNSPFPSGTDENTLRDAFGGYPWSVMFICARDSSCYARMVHNAGPGMAVLLPVVIDYKSAMEEAIADPQAFVDEMNSWPIEYRNKVKRLGGGHLNWTPGKTQSSSPNDLSLRQGNYADWDSMLPRSPSSYALSRHEPDLTLDDDLLALTTLESEEEHQRRLQEESYENSFTVDGPSLTRDNSALATAPSLIPSVTEDTGTVAGSPNMSAPSAIDTLVSPSGSTNHSPSLVAPPSPIPALALLSNPAPATESASEIATARNVINPPNPQIEQIHRLMASPSLISATAPEKLRVLCEQVLGEKSLEVEIEILSQIGVSENSAQTYLEFLEAAGTNLTTIALRNSFGETVTMFNSMYPNQALEISMETPLPVV